MKTIELIETMLRTPKTATRGQASTLINNIGTNAMDSGTRTSCRRGSSLGRRSASSWSGVDLATHLCFLSDVSLPQIGLDLQ